MNSENQTSPAPLITPVADSHPQRRPATLAGLTPDQQEQLFEWLELLPVRDVLEKVAAPPPNGFGIRTHLTTLRRFHQRARTRFRRELLEAECADHADANAAPPRAQAYHLAARTLQNAAIELAAVHANNPASFQALARWAFRLRELDQRDQEFELQKQRLEIEREKFQFNAARAALMHAVDLQRIFNDHSKDDEDKIMAARERLFGPRSLLIEPKPNTPQPLD